MANESTSKSGAPKTPAAPATTPEPEKAKKQPLQSVFDTAELATKAAGERTKGPRRAFTCEHGGKSFHVVANNEGRAGGLAFGLIGGKVTEIGRKAKAAKAVGVDAIMQAVNALPEAEREAVLKQLAGLKK